MYYKKGDKIEAYDIAINKWEWIGGTMLNPVRYYDRKFNNDIALEFEVYDYEVWGEPLEEVGLRYYTDYKVPTFTKMLDDLLGEDSYEQLMSMMDEWEKDGVLSSRYYAFAEEKIGEYIKKNEDKLKQLALEHYNNYL